MRKASTGASAHAGRRRLAACRMGAVIATAVLGVLIGRAAPPAGHQAMPTKRAPSVVPTRHGAALAAIGYLDALDWDVLVDDVRRRRAIGRLATARAVRRLDADLAIPAEALRGAVTQRPIVARSAVLGYRTSSIKARRVSVRIWGMSLFGTGVYGPVTQWSTSDIGLVWSGERWLVDGVRSRGGPSPDSPLRTLARSDRSLEDVRNVP